MIEPPKKIWLRWGRKVKLLPGQIGRKADEDITYIRADLVDELIKALEYIKDYDLTDLHITDIERAALDKIEGESNIITTSLNDKFNINSKKKHD